MLGAGPLGADEPDPSVAKPAHISETLDEVAVSGAAYDRARSVADDARARLDADRARLRGAQRNIEMLTATRNRLLRSIDSDTDVKSRADAEILVLSVQLRRLALQAYVGADDSAAEGAAITLDTAIYERSSTSRNLRRAVTDTSRAQYRHELAISDAARRRLEDNRARLARTVRDLDTNTREAADAREAVERDRAAVHASREAVRDARATAVVDGTDLPLVVLDAYLRASRVAALTTPGCHLPWSLLAGIGKVESGQGTHGGASVRADGTLTHPITGIPLDGSNETEVIPTGDGGYMRAEGPMQFLPSTWAHVAVDGDDDGHADIQNFYDAAVTAGAYLCRNGVDVATPRGRRAAILSYNFSGAYVTKVTGEMQRYAEALPDVDRD